jgi:hypothetical protein
MGCAGSSDAAAAKKYEAKGASSDNAGAPPTVVASAPSGKAAVRMNATGDKGADAALSNQQRLEQSGQSGASRSVKSTRQHDTDTMIKVSVRCEWLRGQRARLAVSCHAGHVARMGSGGVGELVVGRMGQCSSPACSTLWHRLAGRRRAIPSHAMPTPLIRGHICFARVSWVHLCTHARVHTCPTLSA